MGKAGIASINKKIETLGKVYWSKYVTLTDLEGRETYTHIDRESC